MVGGYADKLQQKVGGVLRPGEAFAAAVRTMPSGTTMGTAVGGLIGEAIGAHGPEVHAGEREETVATEAVRAGAIRTDGPSVLLGPPGYTF